MARRYRRRYGAGRDLFPTQVAAVAVVALALLGALVVWTLLPERDGASQALAREEADRASFGVARDTAPAPRVQELPVRPAAVARSSGADAPAETSAASGTSSPVVVEPPAPSPSPAPPAQAPERGLAQAAPPRGDTAVVSDAAYSPPRPTDRVPERRPVQRESTASRRSQTASPTRASSSDERMTLFTAVEANAAGQQALAAGNAREAVIHFQRATTLEPGDAAYRTSYASALLRTGDAPSAVRQLEQVLRDNNRLAGVWALLGEARLARGDTAGARFAYGRYVELERDPRLRAEAQARVERLRSNL